MTSYYLKLVSSVIILVLCVVLRDVQLAGSCKRVDHFFADAGRIARLPNHFQIVSAFRPFYVTVYAELQLPRLRFLHVYLVARTGIPRCSRVNATLWFVGGLNMEVFFVSCSDILSRV
jgi:hypothetical protein